PPPTSSRPSRRRCGRARSPRSAQRSRWPVRCFVPATGRARRARSPVRRPVTMSPSVPGWRPGWGVGGSSTAPVDMPGAAGPWGRRSLEHAFRLGEPEQFRLPFALDRDWLRPVLHRDPELAQQYRRLLEPDLVRPGWMEARQRPGQAAPMIVETLSEREREVLQHVSALESTAEIATEMSISVNRRKPHLKSIYRKLAVTHRGEAVRRARKLGLL